MLAELCAKHGVQAVSFDRAEYFQWLADRQDSETLRALWAAEIQHEYEWAPQK